ncbi:MAG: hypothetical protein MUD08_05890 [Cytophagales bacterium]|nr:hypothetical protein [Cytophagales bacterium]
MKQFKDLAGLEHPKRLLETVWVNFSGCKVGCDSDHAYTDGLTRAMRKNPFFSAPKNQRKQYLNGL